MKMQIDSNLLLRQSKKAIQQKNYLCQVLHQDINLNLEVV